MAKHTVNISAGLLKLPILLRSGTCFILLNIASILDAEYTLAITPDTVATIAKTTIRVEPQLPKIGSSAAAFA
jgi:hypothetical protein